MNATGDLRISGKVVRGDDPRARKPATGHGHARTRRAGCSDVASTAEASAAKGEGSLQWRSRVTGGTFAVEPSRVVFRQD